MRLIRRHLIVLVLVVTACQIVGVAAAPVVLCQMGEAATGVGDEVVCTCGHDSGAQCPVHKHQQPPSPSKSSPKDCRCSGAGGGADTMLTALMAFAGPLVERRHAAMPNGASESVCPIVERSLNVARPPVSPPPRG